MHKIYLRAYQWDTGIFHIFDVQTGVRILLLVFGFGRLCESIHDIELVKYSL